MRDLVTADSRGRVSLGRFGADEGSLFRASVDEDGTIHLIPVRVVPGQ